MPLQDSFAALGMDEASVTRAVDLYRARFATHGLYENRLYEGALPSLDTRRDAQTRLAVATSKPTPFAEQIVSHFGLAEQLELVVGAALDGTRRHKADAIVGELVEILTG